MFPLAPTLQPGISHDRGSQIDGGSAIELFGALRPGHDAFFLESRNAASAGHESTHHVSPNARSAQLAVLLQQQRTMEAGGLATRVRLFLGRSWYAAADRFPLIMRGVHLQQTRDDRCPVVPQRLIIVACGCSRSTTDSRMRAQSVVWAGSQNGLYPPAISNGSGRTSGARRLMRLRARPWYMRVQPAYPDDVLQD